MLKPIIAMMCLTLIVLSFMAYKRLHYLIKFNRNTQKPPVPNQLTPTRAQMADFFPQDVMYPANNLQNLFEMPVLFYVVCILAEIKHIGHDAPLGLSLYTLAWVYVFLRVFHSFIHCTYNKLAHRFTLFFISTVILYVMIAQITFLLFY